MHFDRENYESIRLAVTKSADIWCESALSDLKKDKNTQKQ